MTRSLVIFLHGVGSRGADIGSLGQLWRAQLADTAFAAPDAPFAFDLGGAGHQWFSVKGVTEANRPARVLAAREAFDDVLSKLIAAHGLGEQLDRVALVGFSQGSIMALDALASGRWPVGAIVAFSGRLASPVPLTPSTVTKTLLIHGDADTVMPVGESRAAQASLQQAGVEAQLRILPGVPHTVSREGADLAGAFLSEAFG